MGAPLFTDIADDRAKIRAGIGLFERDLQMFSLRAPSLAWDQLAGAQSGRNDTRGDYRMAITPAVDVFEVTLVFGNFNIIGTTTGGEAANANAITVDAAIELPSSGGSHPAYFNGQRNVSLAPGAVIEVPIPVDIAAGQTAWVRCGVQVNAGEVWPTCSYMNGATGDGAVESAVNTSQVLNTGSITLPSGGQYALNARAFLPWLVVGRCRERTRGVILTGDSIASGVGANEKAGGNYGGLSMAIHDAGVPHVRLVRQSAGYGALSGVGVAKGRRHRQAFMHGEVAVNELGTNDIYDARTLAAVQADASAYWLSQRRAGIRRIVQMKLLPRTQGSWLTPGGQTFTGSSVPFAPGGIRDQFNAWLDERLAAGEIDGIINPNITMEDASNPGKWVTNGSSNLYTYDGTHLTNAGQLALRDAAYPVVQAVLATI